MLWALSDIIPIRFEAAYAQSSADLSHLSFNNYERELELNPFNSFARNNFAVQLANFGMLSKSVEHYERARVDGNTLAAANLAYLYIEKGLLADAIRLLREAQGKENYHENIDRALTDLHRMEESENEKLAEVRQWMPMCRKFLRQYADARLIPKENNQQFSGSWSSESTGTITITQENGVFHAEWSAASSGRKLHGVQYNNGAELKLYTMSVNPFALGIISDSARIGVDDSGTIY